MNTEAVLKSIKKLDIKSKSIVGNTVHMYNHNVNILIPTDDKEYNKKVKNVLKLTRKVKIHKNALDDYRMRLIESQKSLFVYCDKKIKDIISRELAKQHRLSMKKQKLAEVLSVEYAILAFTPITDLPLNLILNYTFDLSIK